MSKEHLLAQQIKKFVDNPNAWLWQAYLYDARPTPRIQWDVCSFASAIRYGEQGTNVRLIPKHSMIPSHLLPEGWEVERTGAASYVIKSKSGAEKWLENKEPDQWLFQLLRHIDPEASDE